MRNLTDWISAALVAQPFYSEEIRLVQLLLQTWRHRLPHSDRFDSKSAPTAMSQLSPASAAAGRRRTHE